MIKRLLLEWTSLRPAEVDEMDAADLTLMLEVAKAKAQRFAQAAQAGLGGV